MPSDKRNSITAIAIGLVFKLSVRPQLTYGQLWARIWFITTIFRIMCVCTYLLMFVCPYTPTHVSKFLSGEYSLYVQNEGKTNPL